MAQERLKKLREELAQRKSERLYEKQEKPADSGLSGVMVAFNCRSASFSLNAWSPKTRSRGAVTDNMETQAWSHDAQPSFENGGVARQLSFDGVASEPSPPADRKAEAARCDLQATKCVEPPVSVSGPRPKRRSWRRRGACQVKPKAASKPDPAVPKPPEPAEEAPKSLPEKPDCMQKMKPALSPDEQQQPKPKGRAKKSKDEDEEMDEEDEQEEEGDDQNEPTDGEEFAEEEEEEEEDDEREADDEPVMKRPAAKGSQQQEQAKPKAKAKAKGKATAKSKAKSAPKSKAKAKAKAKNKGKAGSKDDEDKALKSRKSVAYHRAKKEALSSGMTAEEASEIAKIVALHACVLKPLELYCLHASAI